MQRALFNPNLHLIIISNPFFPSMTQIGAGTVPRQPPVRITTVINNRMHDSGPAHSPMINTITLYRTRMAHIFVQVCAWAYNGVLPSIFACYRGPQYLLQMAEIFSHLCLDAAATKQRHALWPGSLGPHGARKKQAH